MRAGAVAPAQRGVAQHFRIFVGVALFARGVDDLAGQVGDHGPRHFRAIGGVQLRQGLDHAEHPHVVTGQITDSVSDDVDPADGREFVQQQ